MYKRQEQASLIATDRDKWELFSPAEKVPAYQQAKTAMKWAAAVDYRFEQDVAAGLIPGFEMAPGRTSFTVTDQMCIRDRPYDKRPPWTILTQQRASQTPSSSLW